MNMEKYEIEDLIKAVRIEAHEREQNAAYGGRMDDGGSGSLLKEVEFYEKGLRREYPKEWERYSKHIDPEYKEYMRLKNKFDN